MDTDPPTQTQYVSLAWDAVSKAAQLASRADNAARQAGKQDQVGPLAAAGALWADVARSYTAIAAVLPDGIEDAADTNPEV